MTKTWIFAGVASLALAVSPALAEKVEKFDGTKVTVGGKEYRVSASRSKIKINGADSVRDAIKVGMDCTVTAAERDEVATIDCK